MGKEEGGDKPESGLPERELNLWEHHHNIAKGLCPTFQSGKSGQSLM